MKSIRANIGFWTIVPLLSGLTFFLIFDFCARNLNMGDLQWSLVKTNAETAASKRLTAAAGSGGESQTNKQAAIKQKVSGKTGSTGYASGAAEQRMEKPEADRLTKELAVRIFWGISGTIFGFLCLAVVYQSIRTIHDALGPCCYLTGPRLACIAIIALVILGGRSAATLEPAPAAGGKAAEELFKVMEGKAPLIRGEASIAPMSNLRRIVRYLEAAWQVAVAAVALAACAVLWKTRRAILQLPENTKPSQGEVKAAAAEYEKQASATVSLLQLTAFALVSGVVEVYLLYHIAAYRVAPVLYTDVLFFGEGWATATGVIYSGMLTAIFLPLYSGQKVLGQQLVREHGPMLQLNATKYLSTVTQPDASQLPIIKAALAILSPVLVAFFTKLATYLTNQVL